MGELVGRRGGRVLAIVLWLAPLELAAQSVELHADGSLSLGFSRSTQPEFQADPLGEAPEDSDARFFTEVRPTISLQSVYRRWRWGIGYQFAGQLTPESAVLSYSNQADVLLAAEPTVNTQVAFIASLAQGSSSTLVSLRPADTAQPALRAPSDPSRITAIAAESLAWELAPTTSLQHAMRFTASAPEDALDESSSDLLASLAIERARRRMVGGLEVRSRYARLRPIQMQFEPYSTLTNAVLIRGSLDLSAQWNTQGSLGIEQVFTDHSSKPLALLPTASAAINFWTRNTNFAMEFTRGALPNLEIGTLALTNRVVARGLVMFDDVQARALRFSAGLIHNEPIGQYEALAAGINDAVQADLGLTTAINRRLLLFARYGASHQFERAGMLPSTTMHVVLVGVSAQYSNTGKPRRPMPMTGRRVDNVDGVPVNEAPRGDDGDAVKQ